MTTRALHLDLFEQPEINMLSNQNPVRCSVGSQGVSTISLKSIKLYAEITIF
jgi:hypothetical protein